MREKVADGVVLGETHQHGSSVTVTKKQRTDDIEQHNREIQRDGGAPTKSFGKVEANVPEVIWDKACRENPDLVCPDRDIQHKARQRWIRNNSSWRTSKPKYVNGVGRGRKT